MRFNHRINGTIKKREALSELPQDCRVCSSVNQHFYSRGTLYQYRISLSYVQKRYPQVVRRKCKNPDAYISENQYNKRQKTHTHMLQCPHELLAKDIFFPRITRHLAETA